MGGGPWSRNSVFQLIIIPAGVPGTGLFVYNGAPGPGNPPVFSVVAPGVTADPFGNAVTAVMQAGVPGTGQTNIDASGDILLSGADGSNVIRLEPANQRMLIYSDPAGANALIMSVAVAGGTDSFGNHYLSGTTSYAGAQAVQLGFGSGALSFYTGSLAAGWTSQGAVVGSGASLTLAAGAGGVVQTNQLFTALAALAVNASSLGSSADLEVHTLIGIASQAAAGTPPAGFGYLYVSNADGSLHYKGHSGTDTMIAPG